MKSTVTDHCKRETHIMDWEKTKAIRTENNKLLDNGSSGDRKVGPLSYGQG